MLRHMGMIVVAVIVVAVLLASTVAFTVPSTERVLVKRFGQTIRVLDGTEAGQAGLQFKWPYPVEKVVRYEAGTFIFDDAEAQFQTRDKRPMLATMFCAWRIADPQKFNRSVETVQAAERALRDLLAGTKQNVLPRFNMEDYVNAEEGKMKLAQIEQETHDLIAAQALRQYGVQVVTVGFKSLALPESVTKTVIDMMKSERQAAAANYKASGEADATAIIERARAASQQIASFAETKAVKIRAEGEAAAAKYLETFAKNEELGMFLRWLDSMKVILKDRAVIVLDPKVLPPLGWFQTGVQVGSGALGVEGPAKPPAEKADNK